MALENQIIGVESGGNPYARNPRSSAGGLGQFLNGTWLATIKRHRPDIANGRSDAELLQLKFDPNLSREMTAAYAKDNQGYLQAQGIPTTPGNTYLAHFAGPQGAAKLHANPSASAEAILGSKVVEANPFLRGMSGQDVINWSNRKMGDSNAGAAKMMAENLRQKFSAREPSSVDLSGAQAQASMAGGSGSDQLRPTYDQSKIDLGDRVTAAGTQVASQAQNWQQALLGVLAAAGGRIYKGDEGEKRKAYAETVLQSASGASNPLELGRALLSSPDDKVKAAGLELIAKNVGQAPQSRQIEEPWTGRKVTQDYINGQWVTQGESSGGSPSPAQTAAAAPGATLTQTAPQMPAPPMAAPEPPIQPQQGIPMPERRPSENDLVNLMRQQASEGGVNAAAKADMMPMGGGQTVAQPTSVPSQPTPVPPPAASGIPGPVVAKSYLPEGMVQRMGPDGNPLWLPDANGRPARPLFENKTEADERGKAMAGREADVADRAKAANGFSSLLGELKMAPNEYGKQAFERAIGPWSATSAVTEKDSGGLWGSGLSVDKVGQNIARFNAEAEAYLQGGAAPTEVRDSVETKLVNLATLAKPFVRKPGEGAWTDADQANLERIVGKASRAKDTDEYNRRLEEAERVLSKAFNVKIPRSEAVPRTENAPKTAEQDVTGWEAYRKQYLGF